MRTIRYREIAEELRSRIESGDVASGRLLPSEAELSREFDASRVTVRKALEALRGDGLVDSRQGFGWFVAADPLRQSLGRLGTIEGQLAESGRDHDREVLDFRFLAAPQHAAAVLGVDRVLMVRRLSRADGQPFARVTIWCPEHLAADISLADVEKRSFQDLLEPAIGGATQTIGAALASAEDAADLSIPEGSPVLVAKRTTRDDNGAAMLLSEHVFPGFLTEFVVDLPGAQTSAAPSGLRLVEEVESG